MIFIVVKYGNNFHKVSAKFLAEESEYFVYCYNISNAILFLLIQFIATTKMMLYGYTPSVLADPHEEFASTVKDVSMIMSPTAPSKSVHLRGSTTLADS